MARLILTLLLFSSTALIVLESCSSGKKSYQRGNYFEAVMTSTNRLRRDANHSKSIETLRQAYPLAVSFYDDRANAAIASNAPFKWTTVVESYTTINVMYDEIRRSPGALKVIPNPVNYHDKLAAAKQNAAEENYAAGLEALAMGTRDKAKQAYYYFKQANAFVVGYKDVNEFMDKALWAATVKVVMEPIPVPRNVSVSAEFFDNKVSEYLHASTMNEFVRFYTRKEAQTLSLIPDHVIQIAFDDFAVGQVFMFEKEYQLERDSIVVGTYLATSLTGNQPTGGERQGEVKDDKKYETPPDKSGDVKKETTPVAPKEEEKKEDPVKEEKKDEPAKEEKKDEPAKEEKKDEPAKEEKKEESSKDDKKDESSKDDKKEEPVEEVKIDEKDQVTICHIPPGNPGARHTLVVSRSAVDAHLKHGDILGACEDQKEKGKSDDKGKPTEQKPKDNKGTEKKSGGGGGFQASLVSMTPFYLASSNNSLEWLGFEQTIPFDTVKVYSKVKATYYYYKKTTTSKGTLNFQIIDARTNAVLSVEKMPGEYVWVSEWATFNGDERALSAQQLQITKQREQVPPPHQELFIEFTRPIYDQVISRITSFYKNY